MMDAPYSAHYADVRQYGGLGPALETVAREVGVDLGAIDSDYVGSNGRIHAPRIGSGRGTSRIDLGTERRQFFLEISQPGFTWASGATDDLRTLVMALGAWRAGMPLDEFGQRFPFMRVSPVARYYEAGEPAAGQWEALLTDEVFAEERPLVEAVHSDGRFTALLPGLSHGTLTLSPDVEDVDGRQLTLSPRREGGYIVRDTESGIGREVASISDALEVLATMFEVIRTNHRIE